MKSLLVAFFLSASLALCNNIACTGTASTDIAALQAGANAGSINITNTTHCSTVGGSITVSNAATITGVNGAEIDSNNGKIFSFQSNNITLTNLIINGGYISTTTPSGLTYSGWNITFNTFENLTSSGTANCYPHCDSASGNGNNMLNFQGIGLVSSHIDNNTFKNIWGQGYPTNPWTTNGAPSSVASGVCYYGWGNPAPNGCVLDGWGSQGITLDGMDQTTINNNTFDQIGNDAMHIDWNVFTGSTGPQRTTTGNQIKFNKMTHIRRIPMEIQSQPSYPNCAPAGSCNGGIVNTTGMQINGNYVHDYSFAFGDSWGSSLEFDGNQNGQDLNNTFVSNNGLSSIFSGMASCFELALNNGLLQGNVCATSGSLFFGGRVAYGGNSNSSFVVTNQNNINCGSSGIGAVSHEGSGPPTVVDQFNYLNTSNCPAGSTLTTPGITSAFSTANGRIFAPSTSQTFSFNVISNLSIKFVNFYVDGSPTATVYQEQQDQNTNFGTDRKWLYHATFNVGSTPGTHTIQAVATDVSDNVTGGTQSQTYSITGSGPSFSASPSSLTFASTNVGTTTAAQTVTITNPGTTTMTISSQVATGDYAIVSNTCGSTIAAGGTCTFGVTFTPTVAGTRTGAVTFTDNAPSSPHAIGLTGTGVSVTPSCSAPGSPPNLIVNPCGASGLTNWAGSGGSSTTSFQTGAFGPSGVSGFMLTVSALTLPLTGNIELFQNGVAVAANTSYELKIDYTSNRAQNVNILGVQNGGSFTPYGLSCPKAITTSFTTLICDFTTNSSPTTLGPMRMTMQMDAAHQGDTFSISNISLLPASSAAVNISNIHLINIDHASANLQFLCSAACYPYVKYGLSSGNYTFTGPSYPEQYNSFVGGYAVSNQLSGLAPSTTYYALPTARPDADDDTGICNVAGCGAVEQVFTTLPLPATHPAPPVAPTSWVPALPNTSAYTIIPMIPSPTTGECLAQMAVAAPAGVGWIGTVSAGDNIQKILNEIGYSAVIEFPQGAVCKVIQQNTFNHAGYNLPALALDPAAGGNIDSPNHRWIVFRTKQVNSSDFPPFGVRTGSAWATKLAKLIVQTPGTPTNGDNPGIGVQNFTGQIFDCGNSQCHHFWWSNLEMTHLADSAVYPGNVIDPPGFGAYIRTAPASGDVATASTTPNYNVVDRVYAHGQPWPSREIELMTPGGNHWAIINSDLEANMWWPGIYPLTDPTYSGSTITIPQQTFQYNAFDGAPIGMTGSATATFTVPNGYTGVFFGWLDTNGLSIGWQTATGVSLSCSGCISVPLANPTQGGPGVAPSYPASAMLYFTGKFDGVGHATETNSTAQVGLPGINTFGSGTITAFRPIGLYLQGGNFGYFDNNFITAIGQTAYEDPYNQSNDYVWTHNYWYFPRSKMKNSGQWDGYKYSYRNVLESKIGQRWSVQGNFFDGASAYQNPGNAVYMTGSGNGPVELLAGITDWNVSNNTLKHLSSGMQCAAGGSQYPPDHGALRIKWSNNLFWDLNRDLYNDGGGGFFSGAFSTNASCEDMDISNNTVALTKGNGPALLLMGGVGGFAPNFIPGTTDMGEGLSYKNNVLTMSLTNQDLESVFYSICGQITASHPAFPADACGATSTYTQMLNGSFLEYGASNTPSWVMPGNIIIGGVNTGAAPTYTDLTQSQINTVSSTFPTGSPANQFVSGNTLAIRQAAVNWDPNTFRTNPSSYNNGVAGANIDTINNVSGVVSNITLAVVSNSTVAFSYTAPDAKACSIGTSQDGITWSRVTDSGGATSRTIKIGSLSATFQYRLMCYSDQSASFEFLPNQITSGTFTFHTIAYHH